MAKKKNWELAFQDYKDGVLQTDIAKKYKVSVAAVKSWQQRHWKCMQEEEDKAKRLADIEAGLQGGIQGQAIDLEAGRSGRYFGSITQKQINDTNPARIYAEYNKDNLPSLEPRQARFVEEYIIDLNKADAAIRAGYSVANAPDVGCHLYKNPAINAHIQVALAERRRRTGINADTTIRELARIALANPARVIAKDGSILDNATEDDLAAISSIKVKTTQTKNGQPIVEREVRFHDKNKALELFMKSQGMMIDRQQVMVAQGTFDITKMSTQELQDELKKQQQLSNTINIHPICAQGEDNEGNE